MITTETGSSVINDKGEICTYYCSAPEPETFCSNDKACDKVGNDLCCAKFTPTNGGDKVQN